MPKFYIIIFFFIINVNANLCLSQVIINKNGAGMSSFVPKNWEIIDSVVEDFNKDQLLDFAIVIQKVDPEYTSEAECFDSSLVHPKYLIIAFSNGDNSYTLNQNTNVLFGKCNWGLQGGDPFSSIGTRNRTLKVEFFSGGSTRVISTYYFQYQNEEWLLIGYTLKEFDPPSRDYFVQDNNLINGQREEFELIDGKRKNLRNSKFLSKSLIRLSDFDATGGIILDE